MSAQDIAPDKSESTQALQDSAEALGATLAEARNRLGLEQREVATRLGLNPVLIRRLEEGAFDALGAPVYVRGYLTRYARFLDLSEQHILERHKRLGVNELPPLRVSRPLKPQAKMTDTSVRWFSYLLVFALIGWVGWQGFQQVADHWESTEDMPPLFRSLTGNSSSITLPQREPAPRTDSGASPAPQVTASTPVPLPAESSAPAAAPGTAAAPAVTNDTPTVTATPEPTTPTPPVAILALPVPPLPATETPTPPSETAAATPQPAVGAADSPAPPTKPTTATGSPELVIAVAQDCWVDIRDANGQRLVYGIMKADTVSTVSGPGPFSVTLGNAVGVREIKLNGQPVEQSVYIPRRGTVSRFTLETQPPATLPST
jgi:cytoskeleton protein RodZ